MSVVDHVSLVSLAQRLHLVTEDQVRECLAEIDTPNPSPEAVLRVLERKGYLTPWQASKLMKGETDGYFLGGYRLLYKISAGTFGRVYRADDPRSGEVVAIKVLRRRWTENPQKIDLFEREGKMGMAIRHLNIVSVLAVSKDPKSGQYFLVMEFVEGGNLKDILNIRKKLAAAEALKILEEAVGGLAFAFSKGMTHRDIKPTNILISSSGVSKLVDFGLAELTGPMGTLSWGEEDTEVDQSIDYAGLEQATGCKPGDIRSDIYFLGCVFYHMLTGSPLLSITKDARARKNRQRFDVVQQLDRNNPDIPPIVFALLAKMIAFEANDRFQTPSQLLDAIRNVRSELTGQPALGETHGSGKVQKTVYVVEHHPKLQDVFREKLKEQGFRVLLSIDAERALQRFKQQPFHALIVDVGTAGEEGLEAFCRVMREADKMNLKCSGVLIFNEDQDNLKAKAPQYENVTTLVRPVILKHIYQALGVVE